MQVILRAIFCLLLVPSSLLAQEVGDKDGLLKPISIEQLEKQIKEQLKTQISINDYRPYPPVAPGVRRMMARPAPVMAPSVAAGQVSSTNLQEQGVDEADMLKTDGRYLYGVNQQGGGIRVFDTQNLAGAQLKQIATLGMPANSQLHGLYLVPHKKQLIALSSTYQSRYHHMTGMRYGGSGQTSILIFNVANPAKPQLIRQLDLDGIFFQSRRINNRLYLVLNQTLNGSYPVTYKSIESKQPLTEAQKDAEKKKIIAEIDRWKLIDSLPSYLEKGNKKPQPLLKEQLIYSAKQKVDSINGLASMITLDLDNINQAPQSFTYLGSATNLYMSAKAAYLMSPAENVAVKAPISSMQTNLLHKLAVSGKGLSYRGSGAFFGVLSWSELSTFQFDEDQRGNLRVVTYNGAQTNKHPDPITRSPVILTVLAEHPSQKQLVTVARLPNAKYPKPLGKPGERLYGARLFNDYAYFVTFRNTDPLYVVDLRNPREPKVSGELVIPGFSDYLHPVTSTLLLGVGKVADAQAGGAQQGWKLSLFDISNPNHPQEVDKVELGSSGSDSPANRNHHALTSLAINNNTLTRVALPVNVVDSTTGNINNGLHRFEVDHAQRKLKHLGGFSVSSAQNWYWDDNDRSILIDDKLYYFHNGNFYASAWAAK